MDWLPTFLAMACVDDNKEQLFEGGVQENGREYKVYLNGYNMVLVSLTSGIAQAQERPRLVLQITVDQLRGDLIDRYGLE
jgi:hypothetical protein